MNSNNVIPSYATNEGMKYGAHYITLSSEKVTYENPVGKFVMTYVTPNMSTEYFDKQLPSLNDSNVINDDNLGLTSITSSNYIELEVPKYFFYITKLEIQTNLTKCACTCEECSNVNVCDCNPKIIITRQEYYKGQQFIVVNGGGYINHPLITGLVV